MTWIYLSISKILLYVKEHNYKNTIKCFLIVKMDVPLINPFRLGFNIPLPDVESVNVGGPVAYLISTDTAGQTEQLL